MLVTLSEVLQLAEAKKCAVGSFNTPNLESIMAVIEAAEELNVPVIIMHAEVHEPMMPISVIGPIMIERAKVAKVPVCVHLDHGETLAYLDKALNIGFTSVMFDGSALPYEENVANTKIAVKLAHAKGASVEAEIGTLGKRELGLGHDDGIPTGDEPKKIYTDPKLAESFVNETGIDALACSFGTAHGLYLTQPKLDMSVLEAVKARVVIPSCYAWWFWCQRRRLQESNRPWSKKDQLLYIYGKSRWNWCRKQTSIPGDADRSPGQEI